MLIPTRDHAGAAQLLVRRGDLRVVAISGGGPGNRSIVAAYCKEHGRVLADGGYRGVHELDTPVFRGDRIVRDASWRRHRRRRARVEHAIARLKNWRVLRDHRRRAMHLPDTLRAVASLHDLQIVLRDSP